MYFVEFIFYLYLRKIEGKVTERQGDKGSEG